MKYYLGLDVHSKKTSYCYQDETGKILGQGSIISNPASFQNLKEQYSIPDETVAGLESGTQAVWTVKTLYDIGLKPIVINAFEVRQKARRQRQKTDQRDAFEICNGIRRGIYDSIVYIPEPGILRIRKILSRRRHYVKLATMEINTAKFVVREDGQGAHVRSLQTAKAWEKLLANPQLPDAMRNDVRRHFQTWLHAREQVNELETELKEALRPYQQTIDLLMTMPGVGPIIASNFFATVGDVKRFRDGSSLVSYLGLAPSMQDSGGKEKHGGITKCGSKEMRSLMCEAGHQARRLSHPLRPYFLRYMVQHGRKRAVVSVAHRMVRIMYQMWKRNEGFDATKLNVELITVEGKSGKPRQQYTIAKTAVH